ncbi:hypothetical protein BV22DRAFT_1030589 [Leucogyrophana mollusca]|uniref:Uncharacterized protein n=1 Tax=Leucogyrophana mollusca TaxID=85980 RepID=A0ACB8BT82_9AGAM|nr:hypothetical protein BV22DRAFT_1030589 [Leucogyrophana mollusca]
MTVVISGGRTKVQSKGRRVGKTSAQKARRQTPGRSHALVSAHEGPTCAHRDAHARGHAGAIQATSGSLKGGGGRRGEEGVGVAKLPSSRCALPALVTLAIVRFTSWGVGGW